MISIFARKNVKNGRSSRFAPIVCIERISVFEKEVTVRNKVLNSYEKDTGRNTRRDTGRNMKKDTRRNTGRITGRNKGKVMDADYRLIMVIGEGAFSKVYLAEDRDGRQYACKVSREVKMLRREAEILSGLYHPLFPAYMGYEENGGLGRLFMEFIPGRSLGEVMRIRGRFSSRQTMRMAEALADGLRYLHERQPAVLYRDLKPENIMLCENGRIKLIDLGCACCQDVQGGEKAGTPGFAPPEQLVSGGTAGIYSDVYGLGKTVQSVLTEKRRQQDKDGIFAEKICRRRKRCIAGRKYHKVERKRFKEEKICRRRLERMIEAATREDFRQRPQDMAEVSHILTGQSKTEKGIICEKNIWESCYKNPCSLPLI